LPPQTEEGVCQNGLFTGMGTAPEENAVPGTDAYLTQHGWDVQPTAFVQRGGIEFQTANNMDRFGAATERTFEVELAAAVKS